MSRTLPCFARVFTLVFIYFLEFGTGSSIIVLQLREGVGGGGDLSAVWEAQVLK